MENERTADEWIDELSNLLRESVRDKNNFSLDSNKEYSRYPFDDFLDLVSGKRKLDRACDFGHIGDALEGLIKYGYAGAIPALKERIEALVIQWLSYFEPSLDKCKWRRPACHCGAKNIRLVGTGILSPSTEIRFINTVVHASSSEVYRDEDAQKLSAAYGISKNQDVKEAIAHALRAYADKSWGNLNWRKDKESGSVKDNSGIECLARMAETARREALNPLAKEGELVDAKKITERPVKPGQGAGALQKVKTRR